MVAWRFWKLDSCRKSDIGSKTAGRIWVFAKFGVSHNGWLKWKNLLKWMIWGYPYFQKDPYVEGSSNFQQFQLTYRKTVEGR